MSYGLTLAHRRSSQEQQTFGTPQAARAALTFEAAGHGRGGGPRLETSLRNGPDKPGAKPCLSTPASSRVRS
jgi:hypothetical protein